MAENVKTLLVIGNGFDLAHGLKTRYTDFLKFFNEKIGTVSLSEQLSDIDIAGMKDFLEYINASIEANDDNALYKNLQLYNGTPFGNFWIAYFNKILEDRHNRIGEGWVDFEREIERVIGQLEKLLLNSSDFHKKKSILKEIMGDYFEKSPEIITQEFVSKLNWDLKILILLLEFYLVKKEKNLKANHNEFFKNVKPDAVISYNYTHTFQKLYDLDEKIPVHFIHGELGKHNLVLGTGETLSDDEKNNFTVCASFKKFFQRVKHRLGNHYRKNITQVEDKFVFWQVVIYGHSLDSTDQDSLSWLMKNWKKNGTIDRSQPIKRIFIHYHDENSYNQQIANAIQIVGKDELIDSTSSGRIVFLPMNELRRLSKNYKRGELWNIS